MPEHEAPAAEPEEKIAFFYEGSQFPWFMRIIWVAFLTFAVIYTIKWFIPDLMAYLDHGADLIQ